MIINTVGSIAIPEAGITDAEYVVILTGTKEEIQQAGKMLMQPVELRAARKPTPIPKFLEWDGDIGKQVHANTPTVAKIWESRGGRFRWEVSMVGYPDEPDSAKDGSDWAATREDAKTAANLWAGRALGLI